MEELAESRGEDRVAFNKLKTGFQKIKNLDVLQDVVHDILDNNTFNEIRNGKVYVSYQTINDEIARQISTDSANTLLSELTVTSHSDGHLDILIKTKGEKSLLLTGIIESFVHKGAETKFVYRAENHEITGTFMPSWVFSKLTLGFMRKFIGDDKVSDDVNVILDGNVITVDFSKLLEESRLGKANVKGVKIIDLLEIENATPTDSGIEIKTKWNAINTAKEKLVSWLEK